MASRKQAVTRHDHWRHPKEVPPPGVPCPTSGCSATFAVPDAVVETLINDLHDRRSPYEVYDDVRTYLELVALWILVAEKREDPTQGMSPHEAHLERTRIMRLHYARHPGRFFRVG